MVVSCESVSRFALSYRVVEESHEMKARDIEYRYPSMPETRDASYSTSMPIDNGVASQDASSSTQAETKAETKRQNARRWTVRVDDEVRGKELGG